MRFYHVASARYRLGDDLLCWDQLEERGMVSLADWKWEDAEVGFDSDVVCLFGSLTEAQEFAAECGGQLLIVNLPSATRTTVTDEGYTAVYGRIPATYIQPAEQEA